jgi:hypothetical protein
VAVERHLFVYVQKNTFWYLSRQILKQVSQGWEETHLKQK